MIDPATQAVLEAIVRRESRSLLSYMSDAFPWTTAAGGAALTTLSRLVRQETTTVANLGRYLVRRKLMPPFLGSYPAAFTAYNFLALDHLLPRLLSSHKRLIEEMQADLPQIHDAEARQEAERLLAVKKMTLAGLEALSVPAPAASA